MQKNLRLAILFLTSAAIFGCDRTPETKAPVDAQTKAPVDAQQQPTDAKPSHTTYALEWISNDIPATMPAGKPTAIKVSVKNTGDWAWKPERIYPVRLSYRWVASNEHALPQDSVRGELTAPVPPGGTANFNMSVAAPKEPGNYQLQVDLVEELVAFFSSEGTQRLVVPVRVQ
jgi:hypothetical protein